MITAGVLKLMEMTLELFPVCFFRDTPSQCWSSRIVMETVRLSVCVYTYVCLVPHQSAKWSSVPCSLGLYHYVAHHTASSHHVWLRHAIQYLRQKQKCSCHNFFYSIIDKLKKKLFCPKFQMFTLDSRFSMWTFAHWKVIVNTFCLLNVNYTEWLLLCSLHRQL